MQLSEELARLMSNFGPLLTKYPSDGISNPDYMLLSWLENRAALDGCRLSDIAGARGIDVSTISRRVSHLVDAELVSRAPDPDDGRAQLLRPTAAGRAVVAKERSRRVRLITEALDDWSDDDKSQLARLLARLNHNLENAL